jgi:MscS family membrane protein
MAGVLHAQSPAPASDDPLGRVSPQAAIAQFLEACHARDYSKADHFLDLRGMPAADRAKSGLSLAIQLEDLLDDTTFEIATLSPDPEGDQVDGLGPTFERLATFKVNGQTLDLQLERIELKPGLRVWLVSAASVAMIPAAHKVLAETPFEKFLPQQFVTFEILDTPVWRWIALIVIAVAFWFLATAVAWALVRTVRPLADVPLFRGPLRLFLATIGFRIAMEFAAPSTLPRLFLERAAALAITMASVWGAAAVIDMLAKRWHSRLDPRVQAVSYSVLPLGLQVLKLTLYLIALLSVIRAWGYPISTILAGLGVGGIAVALAAQKTIENLFGGVSVIGDRPVLVGDVCRFGNQTGTVIQIGLRSTRLRTADRTVIIVPNGQFSSMELENFSSRDKIWFHHTLNLRRDTTSEQLSQVLASCREVLSKQPKVELGKMPVRFVGLGSYSLDIEVNVYVTTSDYDEFLALQQEFLLQLLQVVERADTALAVPWEQRAGVSAGVAKNNPPA